MPANRPPVPTHLRRELLVEAGHRCAIPTCRQTSALELDHIVPFATVGEHDFENMIVRCANCHARKTKGEIDTEAMKLYKANLGLLSNRYGEFERREIESFGRRLRGLEPSGRLEETAAVDPRLFILPGGASTLVYWLVRDGLVEVVEDVGLVRIGSVPIHQVYRFTDEGENLVRSLLHGSELV